MKEKDKNPFYNQAECQCQDVKHPQAEITTEGKVVETKPAPTSQQTPKHVKEWQSFALIGISYGIGKYASQSPAAVAESRPANVNVNR